MPRQPRTSSGTGIYHVMLRGINRQDIFEEQEDYQQFLIRLQNLVDPIDDNGEHIPSYFHVYAYCLMSNHVHLLLRERTEIHQPSAIFHQPSYRHSSVSARSLASGASYRPAKERKD